MEKRLFILLSILWIVVLGTAAQSPDRNYIKTTTYLDTAGTSSLTTVQYYDGLGRPIQTVQQNVGPVNNNQDLISLQEYDRFGRDSITWLPVPIAGNNGAYKDPASLKTIAQSSSVYNDTKPYSEPVYEPSPLNRVVQQYGPGQAWRTDGGHPVKTDYLTNSASDCKYYYMSGDVLTDGGYYAASTLYVTKTTDEDNKTSYEFKDKLGRVVLQRQMDGTENFDTYYVYDDLGNLRWVLPPMVGEMPTLAQGCVYYGYSYKYDERNRCIEKLLPGTSVIYGAGVIYYVYDKADRLIFSQDGEQRLSKDWTFYKYDAFGRMILTGVWKNSEKTQANLNDLFKNTLVTESYSATGAYNYTWNTLSGVSSSNVLQVNYYDNYKFKTSPYPGSPFANNANYNYIVPTGFKDKIYGTEGDEIKSKGLLTGTIAVMLDNPNARICTVFYYDDRGQVIQSIASNNVGGYEKEYTNYSFTEKPVWKQMVHTSGYLGLNNTITETYTYGYDHANRPTTTKYKLGTDTEFALSTLSYDNQGRLASKKQGESVEVTATYGYNTRNWLTDIKNSPNNVFSEKIYYNESYAGNTPQYNGNISAVSWQHLIGSDSKGYLYTYDGLNRLKKGQFLSGTPTYETFTEDISLYDKNGNIKKMKRYARITPLDNGTLVDDLTLNYSIGNHLVAISDAVSSTSTISFVVPNFSPNGNPIDYNSNGSMKQNFYNGIAGIAYNVLNLPEKIRFMSGHGIQYSYDASGTRHKAVYQTVKSSVVVPLGTTAYTPNASDVTSTLTTDYCSNGHIVYENQALKRILNPEGYAEKQSNGTYKYFYYAKDHLGNNRAVFVLGAPTMFSPQQEINYYPFGMPFTVVLSPKDGLFPETQPYKFGGKEYDEMYGLNWHDFGARYYNGIVPMFMTMDPLCEKNYSVSPYAYCANNPINAVDRDGRVVIYINGMHTGTGGSLKYWGYDLYHAIGEQLNDHSALFKDGSVGGWLNIANNKSAAYRMSKGQEEGELDAAGIINMISDNDGNIKQTIKVITHSMGAAYAKGYVKALLQYMREHNISTDLLEFEADFAPYQPDQQKAVDGVDTYQFSHSKDPVAGNKKMEGAKYMDTSSDENQTHWMNDFTNQIKNLPEGKYKVVDGKIVPY